MCLSLQGGSEEVQRYIVPMRLPPCYNFDSIYVQTAEDVAFYLDFCGFLPGKLSHRCELMIRSLGCSCSTYVVMLCVFLGIIVHSDAY